MRERQRERARERDTLGGDRCPLAETDLALGYASIVLSRQAGWGGGGEEEGGEKQEGDTS